MPFFTYILPSQSTGRFYVGHTANLPERLAQRNSNHTPSLKHWGR